MEKGLQTMMAAVAGIVLLLVGVIGFFNNPVLGVFGVNTLHNFVHLLTGIIGVFVGLWGGMSAAKTYNKVFGIIYLLVAILGLVGAAFLVNLLALGAADNVLHLLLGVVFAGVGFFGGQ